MQYTKETKISLTNIKKFLSEEAIENLETERENDLVEISFRTFGKFKTIYKEAVFYNLESVLKEVEEGVKIKKRKKTVYKDETITQLALLFDYAEMLRLAPKNEVKTKITKF